MVTMTIQVPETLAEQLEQVRSRLPEILALGLQELSPLPSQVYRYILEFLASDPTQVGLTQAESQELDEYVSIDHLVTMLQARTLPYAESI